MRAYAVMVCFLALVEAYTPRLPKRAMNSGPNPLCARSSLSGTEWSDAVLDHKNSHVGAITAGFVMGAASLVQSAVADTQIEIADLPPPWIPVVFGLGLVVGVGLLTGSLGNVIDEEAKLGLQSGARAKKEIERSRSSYLKKK